MPHLSNHFFLFCVFSVPVGPPPPLTPLPGYTHHHGNHPPLVPPHHNQNQYYQHPGHFHHHSNNFACDLRLDKSTTMTSMMKTPQVKQEKLDPELDNVEKAMAKTNKKKTVLGQGDGETMAQQIAQMQAAAMLMNGMIQTSVDSSSTTGTPLLVVPQSLPYGNLYAIPQSSGTPSPSGSVGSEALDLSGRKVGWFGQFMY